MSDFARGDQLLAERLDSDFWLRVFFSPDVVVVD
jgi:hypothetical protein